MNHDDIDRRSLAMAKLIAARIRENPGLISVARDNLERWLATCSPNTRGTLLEWQTILQTGVDSVIETLCGEDERCTRLRQSSPFAGEEFITRSERTEILQRYRPVRLS